MAGEWEDLPAKSAPSASGGWEELTPTRAKAREAPKRGYSALDALGPADAAANMATGMGGAVIGGLAGIGQGVKNLFSEGMPAGERVRQVQEALTSPTVTKSGGQIAGAIAYPFEKLAEGADWAGGKAADVTGSPAIGAGVNTAIQALPMLLGLGRGPIGRRVAAAQAEADTANALAAPANAGLQAAKEAGLRVPPSQAGSGVILRSIEGLAGEPKTAKLASKKNASTINDLIRKDVGLAEDVPISRKELAKIRDEEGAAYDSVKGIGDIPLDNKYFADFNKITSSFDTAAKDFAHRSENPFQKTMDGLTKDVDGTRKTSVDSASIVEEVKLLRSDANKAYASGDPGLGKAMKSAAQALDDQLLRHVQSDPSLPRKAVIDYLAARQRIAKTYSAEKALNDTTGNIDADVYAKQLEKGVPLSGEGKTVGEFAAQFPRSAQRMEKLGSTDMTLFDALGAMSLKSALALGVRPLMRQAVTMGTPSPSVAKPSGFLRLADALAQNPSLGIAATAAEQSKQ